ncbi:hypothetical protein SLEP1_g28798 [Rubroshorea leprosula]|uniref:Uncharacterized protein n=1 Tax=Rubroshorea leprosula TaxID=152421 RepID=A0AAV5K1X5_9ROSI|nr:hypothetical protein SLEP1_g28798 [Rubroshorea leprosula]
MSTCSDRAGSFNPASGGYTPANSDPASGGYTPANSGPVSGDYTLAVTYRGDVYFVLEAKPRTGKPWEVTS